MTMERAALLNSLAAQILAVQRPHPVRVAIDGVDAAGKTTLAGELAECLRAAGPREVLRATIDRFHNPRGIRYRQGADSPAGYYADSFDLEALRRRLLDPLGPGGSRIIQAELFDFRANAPIQSSAAQAAPDAVLLFDGVFLMRPELAGCWDFSIFVQVSFETVLGRAIRRDSELMGGPQAVIDRYTRRYIPAQRHYLETCRPMERADVIVENDQ
jgi:uridine kinase